MCDQPARTGVLYQSGIAFTDLGDRERDLLLELLVHEAEQQVREWEANLRGEGPDRTGRKPARQSAVAVRFLCPRRCSYTSARTANKWMEVTRHLDRVIARLKSRGDERVD
jgi:hypothetical protein